MKKYRLRYAPSPTGYLHIGNARTALMAYLFAKHYFGTFIVRLEDTDLERNVPGAIESQFASLKWLGIQADESIEKPGDQKYGPYIQSAKFERYFDLALNLVKTNQAYYCFCTPEELENDYQAQKKQGIVATKYNGRCLNLSPSQIKVNLENHKPYTIRFHVPQQKSWKFQDLVRGDVVFHGKDLGDFVIIKTNRIATYNFAVVVDDHDMEITHVLRGEEHLSNTPRQMMLYEAFGWKQPLFGHLTLIVDDEGKKLSKRSGNALFFISEYQKQGYLPQAVFNYIGLLGWSPGQEKEIFKPAELVAIFDEKRFSKSPSTFDMHKLRWLNSQHLKLMKPEEYLIFIKPFLKDEYQKQNFTPARLDQILLLFQKELLFGQQINQLVEPFFEAIPLSPTAFQPFILELEEVIKMIKIFANELNKVEVWELESIQVAIKKTSELTQRSGRKLFEPLRLATTHLIHGPALASIIWLLGSEKVKQNLDEFLALVALHHSPY